MQHRFMQSCLFALSLSILLTPISFAQSKQPPAQRWEYKIIACNDAELNKLGDEGWELVTATSNPHNSCINYTLKRLRPASAPKYTDPPSPPPNAAAPACNLSVSQSPTIRGLRLGMTVEELVALFPGANPNDFKLYKERVKGYSLFGKFTFSLAGAQHKDRIESLRFEVTLFDDRVQSFSIHYPFSNYASSERVFNEKQMIEKMVESFHLLPKEGWSSAYQTQVSLRCQGFKLEVISQAETHIRVEDLSPIYPEKLQQRQQEETAKKRAEFKP